MKKQKFEIRIAVGDDGRYGSRGESAHGGCAGL